MRVLVCGSRTWTDFSAMQKVFVELCDASCEAREPLPVLIHGAARGADSMAEDLAKIHNWSILSFPANWERDGRSAGFKRNQQMLDEGKPDLVLAFWDGLSRGTENMISIARKAGIYVRVFYSSEAVGWTGP